ncbi:hypothetical protein OAT18_00790 [Tenacibaculum sp.]|nr:hypothetical protein [Tenacibaculum sp.]
MYRTLIIIVFIVFGCDTLEKKQKVNIDSNIKRVDTSLNKNKTPKANTEVFNSNKNKEFRKEFWGNGQLASEGYYVNGKANGLMKWYHEKGHLAGIGPMKEGKRDGFWKVYTIEDGKLGAVGNFIEGNEVGLYHENGKIWKERNWYNSVIISEKCWDNKGNIIQCK